MTVGHFSSSISLWIRLFISVRLAYERASASWIKIEPWSVFPTLDILIVSWPFHELRCYTILYPVELYPTFICFTVQGLTTAWKTWSYTGECILFIHLQQWICIKLHIHHHDICMLKRKGIHPQNKLLVIFSNQDCVAIYHIHY